jgi:hypothetical protein
MNHAISACGTTRKNAALTADSTHFVDAKDNLVQIKDPSVDRIVFRALRNGNDLEIATVSSVTLTRRILLDLRNDLNGSRGGPRGKPVEDSLAKKILDRSTRSNPQQRKLLAKYYTMIGRP